MNNFQVISHFRGYTELLKLCKVIRLRMLNEFVVERITVSIINSSHKAP